MKDITVALAAYNGAAYLPEQLRSLAAQTDRHFRVLMRDDGSTDGTAELLRRWAERDSRFVLAEDSGGNLGAKGNFLRLMALDDAPYTALCDQDDVWEPERLSRTRAALADAEAVYGADTPLLVHSDCAVTDADGQAAHPSFFAHQGWDKGAVTLPRLLVQNNVTGCTVLMNAALRELAAQHARPEKLFMHDWFLALTAAAFGHIVFVDAPLVRYRQHGTNTVGASEAGQLRRGAKALAQAERARARIRLTYDHAAMFAEAYGSTLPTEARQTVETYLATKDMPKLKRLLALRRGNYLMQSPVTRVGQMIFG